MSDLTQEKVDRVAEKLGQLYESLDADERHVLDAVFDQAAAYPETFGLAFTGKEYTSAKSRIPIPTPSWKPRVAQQGFGGLLFRRPGGGDSFVIG